MYLFLELLGYWLIAGVIVIGLFNIAKHITIHRSTR